MVHLKRLSRTLGTHLRTGGRSVADVRNIVLLALTIMLILGAHFYLYAYPSLIQLLLDESEQDAHRTASALRLIALEGHSIQAPLTPESAATIEEARQALGVLKIKLFDRDGRVTYSTDSADIGALNTRPYFREIVAQGHTHTHLVSDSVPTLEGERYDRDVVEIYVPVMDESGGFEGAFEIYYDITQRRRDLDQRVRTMNLNLGLLLTVLLVTFAIIGAQSYAAALRRERAHSRRLHEEIEFRLGVEEDLRVSRGHFRHLAHHDPLTDLPNRTLFLDRFEHALVNATRHGTKLALLFIDLDHLKPINDTHGHEAGDRVLVTAAKIMRENIREGDTASRIAGDEFAILIEHAEEGSVDVLADRLTKEFRSLRDLGFGDVRVSASIGISLYPQHGRDVAMLLHRADVAMYRAKAEQRGSWCYYDGKMDAPVAS